MASDGDMISVRLGVPDVFGLGRGDKISGEMLEYSKVNRYSSLKAGKVLAKARLIGEILGLGVVAEYCDLVEHIQLGVDGYSRLQAIECSRAETRPEYIKGEK